MKPRRIIVACLVAAGVVLSGPGTALASSPGYGGGSLGQSGLGGGVGVPGGQGGGGGGNPSPVGYTPLPPDPADGH